MSHDRSSVEAVVNHYFDALYEGDADKMGTIFHPSADLRWVEKGELKVLTVPDWLGLIRKRASAKADGKPREDFIVTIDRSDDNTAFIKVRCQLPPRYFTDYLGDEAQGWLADRVEILPLRSARLIMPARPRASRLHRPPHGGDYRRSRARRPPGAAAVPAAP